MLRNGFVVSEIFDESVDPVNRARPKKFSCAAECFVSEYLFSISLSFVLVVNLFQLAASRASSKAYRRNKPHKVWAVTIAI